MLGHEQKSNNYYNVAGGKIVRSFGKTKPEGIETQSRVNKNGETVYELIYDFIEGRIAEAKIESSENFGDFIKLKITDGKEVVSLSIGFKSSYGRHFIFRIPNFDFRSAIKIKPYSFIDDTGKTRIGLVIYQNGQKIASAHTKDDPNGLPQLEQVTFNGETKWDATKQLAFLRERFDDFSTAVSEHEKTLTSEIQANLQMHQDVASDVQDELDDDLPF